MRDPHFRRAKREGYRSRAAYKLKELDEKFGLFRRWAKDARRTGGVVNVLDLCCSPGSFIEVARDSLANQGLSGGRATLLGVDAVPVRPIDEANLLVRDLFDEGLAREICEFFGGPARVHVVTADCAPKLSGHGTFDHERVVSLAFRALELARVVLVRGGTFVTKVFQGPRLREFVAETERSFHRVKLTKPAASRKSSPEVYCVAEGYFSASISSSSSSS
ncbi:MAG: RlmE family RNA methyltransferase [Promethearchaeota archaeon]